MTITELIETLRQAKRLHGDAEVWVRVGVDDQPEGHTFHRVTNIERETRDGHTVIDTVQPIYFAS